MRRKDRDIIDDALWVAFERGREGSGLGAGHPSDVVKALEAAGFQIVRKAPAAPTFDEAALRAAYRLGYDRGAYDNGGDPAGAEADSPPFRWAEAHDLKAYLGNADAALDAFLGQATAPPAITESASA